MLRINVEVAIFEKENDIQEVAKEAVDLAVKLNCQICFKYNNCNLTANPVTPFEKRAETVRLVEAYRKA